MLNKAIVQDSDQTAQTFSASKVYAVRTLSRDCEADDPRMSQSDWAVVFWYQLYLSARWVRISLSITSEEPAREWSVVKVYKLPS